MEGTMEFESIFLSIIYILEFTERGDAGKSSTGQMWSTSEREK